MASARESARRISCVSNMKQLGTAFQMYTQDYDDNLPNCYDNNAGVNTPGSWIYYTRYPANKPAPGQGPAFDPAQGTLFPYVKNASIYICPDDAEGRMTGDSYAANSCLFYGKYEGFHAGKPLSYFDQVSDWMLLGEEAAFDPAVNSTDDAYFSFYSNFFSTRHLGGTNLVFLDGHAKALQVSQVKAAHYQTGGQDVTECP